MALVSDGQPQSTLVLWNYDGEQVLLNTTLEWRKAKYMAANPKVNLLVIGPGNSARYVQVRGKVTEMDREGAIELFMALSPQVWSVSSTCR